MKLLTTKWIIFLGLMFLIPIFLLSTFTAKLFASLNNYAVLFVPVFALLTFFIFGFFFLNLISGSARKEDSILYASERLRRSLVLAIPLMILVLFTSFLLHEFFGIIYPIDMAPDSLLSLFWIFVTITVFIFTQGLDNRRGEHPKELEDSERYKARFFANLSLHSFLLLGSAFFGYFDSSNFVYKALVIFSIFWSLLIFMYFMEFIIYFANLNKYVYDDLFKKH